MVIKTPENLPAPRVFEKKPRVALALGGGAFHGIAHVGVLKVLEEAGVPIDFIVGASAGSLVGCMYADNPHADSLLGLIKTTKASNIFDFSLFRSSIGFVSGKKLQQFIHKNCKAENIEDTKIPFAAMVTDLTNGRSLTLSSGPMAPSVNASCAIPLVFEPVKMYGLILVDGGVLNNVPADIARASGAEVVIAVDVMAFYDSTRSIDNLTGVGLRSLAVVSDHFKAPKLAMADLVISPNLLNIPYMSGKENLEAYEEGIKATRAALPEILAILKKKGIPCK
ncbi:MAG: patatin-like phospholipase family protein [Bacteroidales bacterium]|nr:patatin-like phospholipase family protein [Bacteroidales bacterium]